MAELFNICDSLKPLSPHDERAYVELQPCARRCSSCLHAGSTDTPGGSFHSPAFLRASGQWKILEYMNGEEPWHAVNPVVRELDRFKRAVRPSSRTCCQLALRIPLKAYHFCKPFQGADLWSPLGLSYSPLERCIASFFRAPFVRD